MKGRIMGGKSAASKRGKRNRQKGNEFERAVAIALRGIWPAAKRGVGQSQAGNNGADVEGTPFWIECKTGNKFTLEGAYRQGETETDGRPVIVVSRRKFKTTKVTMRLRQLIALATAEHGEVRACVANTLVTIGVEVFVGLFDPPSLPETGVDEPNGFNEGQGKIEMDSDGGGTSIEMDSDIPPS